MDKPISLAILGSMTIPRSMTMPLSFALSRAMTILRT